MLFHIRRSPDDDEGAGPEPTPTPPEPKPREQVEAELARKNAVLAEQKAQLEELQRFKAEQESAAEAARQADLEAKGEFAKLREEWAAKEADYQAKLETYTKAEQERAKAKAAQVEGALSKRTDADAMRGKLIRLVGDDPHRQWDLLQELTGTSHTATPGTSAPDLRAGAGEPGEADLTEAERQKCRDLCGQAGRTYEEQVKWLLKQKERIAKSGGIDWMALGGAK